MLIELLVGLLIGFVGFAAVEFVCRRYTAYTLPALLLYILVGNLTPLFFSEPGSTMCLLAFMLAAMISVTIGFTRRYLKRRGNIR